MSRLLPAGFNAFLAIYSTVLVQDLLPFSQRCWSVWWYLANLCTTAPLSFAPPHPYCLHCARIQRIMDHIKQATN